MARRLELSLGEGTMFRLPLGDRAQPILDEQRASGCFSHPGRHTDAFGLGRRDDPLVDLGSNGDRKLR